MAIVIQIIGILIILMAVAYFLKPALMKSILEFLKQGKRLYLAGIIRFVLAIIFFLAARECDVTWAIITFGILFLLGGLLIFIFKLEKLKTILDFGLRQSNLLLRIVAVITLAIGVLIIICA